MHACGMDARMAWWHGSTWNNGAACRMVHNSVLMTLVQMGFAGCGWIACCMHEACHAHAQRAGDVMLW